MKTNESNQVKPGNIMKQYNLVKHVNLVNLANLMPKNETNKNLRGAFKKKKWEKLVFRTNRRTPPSPEIGPPKVKKF